MVDAGADDVFEEARVAVVIDAVLKGNVEGMMRARVAIGHGTRFVEAAGAWKEDLLLVFVE